MIKANVFNLFFFSMKDKITCCWNGELLEGNAFLHPAAVECIPHLEGGPMFHAHLQNSYLFPVGLVPTCTLVILTVMKEIRLLEKAT